MKSPKPNQHDVTCPDCGAAMVLAWSARFARWFYGCERWPRCKATHGAHPDGRPLGSPGTKEVKLARIAAHDAFDRLWKPAAEHDPRNRNKFRNVAYSWLTAKLAAVGYIGPNGTHIGEMNAEQCGLVVDVCRGADPRDVLGALAEQGGHTSAKTDVKRERRRRYRRRRAERRAAERGQIPTT